MSAILGALGFSGVSGASGTLEGLEIDVKKAYVNFPHTSIGDYRRGNIALVNMVMVDTEESRYEKLPFVDEKRGYAMVADAIIDNRKDLCQLLGLSLSPHLTDSQLIFHAFIKWGQNCVDYLSGDFAFAIYNHADQSLFCARDQVGKRLFYYYLSEEHFVFASLIQPILDTLSGPSSKHHKFHLNDQWFATSLELSGANQEYDLSATPVREVLMLPPAHILYIAKSGVEVKRYWCPLEAAKRLKSARTHEENTPQKLYGEFSNLLENAVRVRLRSAGKVGLMLSSGLDSTAVAQYAARALGSEGKVLHGFTAVLDPQYKAYFDRLSPADRGKIYDETPLVKDLVACFNNIELTPLDHAHLNAYNTIDELLGILEQPYRYMKNAYWMNATAKVAMEAGCKVLLDGQFGNYTISQGDAEAVIASSIKGLKPKRALAQIQGYCNRWNLPHSSVYRHFTVHALGHIKKKFFAHNRRTYRQWLKKVPRLINPNGVNYPEVFKAYKSLGIGPEFNSLFSIEDMHGFIARGHLLGHCAIFEYKIGLAHGITRRDPTRDMHLMAFCMSLPSEIWFEAGEMRSLIRKVLREEMQGNLPKAIVDNELQRGVQAADWIKRLVKHTGDLQEDLMTARGLGIDGRPIFNGETIIQHANTLHGVLSSEDEDRLTDTLMAVIVSKYVQKFWGRRSTI